MIFKTINKSQSRADMPCSAVLRLGMLQADKLGFIGVFAQTNSIKSFDPLFQKVGAVWSA